MKSELGTSGRSLFPEYPHIPSMYAEEVKGLADSQVDRIRPEKSWGHWSIRTQVSHSAWVCYLWFLLRWGPVLFGNDLPRWASLVSLNQLEGLVLRCRHERLLLSQSSDGQSLLMSGPRKPTAKFGHSVRTLHSRSHSKE